MLYHICEVPWTHTQEIIFINNSDEIRLFQVGTINIMNGCKWVLCSYSDYLCFFYFINVRNYFISKNWFYLSMWCDCFLSLVVFFFLKLILHLDIACWMCSEFLFKWVQGIIVGCFNQQNKIVKSFTEESFPGC